MNVVVLLNTDNDGNAHTPFLAGTAAPQIAGLVQRSGPGFFVYFNDGNPNTPFLAGTAATQLAALISEPGPGFFVYFNSNLGLNRPVYSTDLSDPTADLKIINRLTNLVGQDAIDAIGRFSAADFELR